MMGCGKSSVGKMLAENLGYHFLDTDQLIEDQEETSIQSIFEKKGERYFRKLEKEILEKLDVKNTIIATGGGVIEIENSIEIFQKIGRSIYLRCSKELLLKRVKDTQKERPNFINQSQFNSLLLKRIPEYEKADSIVDSDLLSAEQICNQIMDQLTL